MERENRQKKNGETARGGRMVIKISKQEHLLSWECLNNKQKNPIIP